AAGRAAQHEPAARARDARRVAAAVEEEDRLAAGRERGREARDERAAEVLPGAAPLAVVAEVDHARRRQGAALDPLGEREEREPAVSRVLERLERRGRA